MNARLLIDTHIALWLIDGNSRLRKTTRALIDTHWQGGGTVLFSAISAWEVALLVEKALISLPETVENWMGRLLAKSGVTTVPIDHETAILACRLHHLPHQDPADRFLIATAIRFDCPLVTYDDRIQRFGRDRGAQYGFACVR